jgi:arylsulfatase A-like enzyme
MEDIPVIYLDIDSLRPDHLGAYGYDHETTPHIDELAEDSVMFANAYAANSPCMPSRAGLLSGRYGVDNGVETHGSRGQILDQPSSWDVDERADWDGHMEDYWTLPELFFHERRQTGAVSSFPRHPALWFHQTWHEFRQPQEPQGDRETFATPRGEEVTSQTLDILERYADDDGFLLYSQFWDPHVPYKRPEEEKEQFMDGALPPYPTEDQIEEHRTWDTLGNAADTGIDGPEDLQKLIASYDAEVHHVDRQVGTILDELREQDLYDEVLIVLTADHGEEFGENGVYGKHWSAHEGTQQIPLIVKPPSGADGSERDELVTNVDIAPTIADYADLDTPASWQGASLRPIVEDTDPDWRDVLVLDHGLYTAQRAVRTEDWKLIETYHPGDWEEQLPERQLYRMDDHWEQDNMAEARPETVERLAGAKEDWLQQYRDDSEPLRAVAEEGPEGYLFYKQWDRP